MYFTVSGARREIVLNNMYYLAIIENTGSLKALTPAKTFDEAYKKYKASTWKPNQKKILKTVDFKVEAKEVSD